MIITIVVEYEMDLEKLQYRTNFIFSLSKGKYSIPNFDADMFGILSFARYGKSVLTDADIEWSVPITMQL